jgi:DNA (cytosine-5)-methyltransferase 1
VKVVDLFSGIGGFSLGLESTGGFETVQFVENHEWCQKVLAKNFPGVPIAGDIKQYEGQKADIVTGGFPCQPFSVAGKRKGTRDDRYLWKEMLRVIKACKPRWVIGENVRNLTSIQEGMVFEQVCTDLESEGFEVQSFIIPASSVNAPHQRYRVWIVAHSDSNRSQSDIREKISRRQDQETSNTKSTCRSEGGDSLSSTSRDEKESEYISNPNSEGLQRLREKNCKLKESSAIKYSSEERRRTMDKEWFSIEPRVGRVANGIPNRVDRLKGLGNAIVPQIAYQLGLAILEADDKQTKMD